MYGYQEAAHYWYDEIAAVFHNNGFKSCVKDKCVFVKTEGDKKAICGLTVDDGFLSLLGIKSGSKNKQICCIEHSRKSQ
jgi:hypothetical protein